LDSARSITGLLRWLRRADSTLVGRRSFDRARETHRGVGVLYAQGERLGGERIYGSKPAVRRMAGCLFDELEPTAPGAGG
jgi:hypothetical protein